MNVKKILVVLPHPDDEVFPMSGTLSQLIQAGAQVTYVCLTLGEMGRNLGNPAFANRVSLPQVRKKELQHSCEIIGIQDLRFWGYHDKTIEFEPHAPLDQRILEVIEEVQPEIIFTYYPGHGVHPDHDACGAAVVRTVSMLEAAKRPEVWCCAFPNRDLREPDQVLDITPYMTQKLGALRAHSTQFQVPDPLDPEKDEDRAFLERIKTEKFWIYDFDAANSSI